MSKYLATYLNDHLAGSTLGLELARRLVGNNADNEYAPTLRELRDEIADDRETLQRLMTGLGVGRDRFKVAAAWSAEKVGRLKPNGHLTSYSPLSRLEELEMLSLGVEGKLAMWSVLRHTQGPTLAGVDFDPLVERANSQRERLEQLRHRASEEAFARADAAVAG
jgi:hypothetical protein